jgi:hypothetical protein
VTSPGGRPRRSTAPIVILVPLIVLATTGAVMARMFGAAPDPAGIATSWVPLYMVAMLLGPLLVATLMFGYAWARVALAALLWGLLAVTLASLPGLFSQVGSGAALFGVFVAVDALALRWVHGPRLQAAVVQAAEARAIRYPAGFGLALVAGPSALLGLPASLVLLGIDARDAGGPDWMGGSAGPARLVLPVLGVSIAGFAIRRLGRSRAPLLGVLGVALAGCAVHALCVLERDARGMPFAAVTAALLTAGLVAATRPRFAAFCQELGRTR